ncbi:hypothetical protein AB0D47_20455 [Streptomyces sp. NPDC048376]|uniref:hypothetical protein n=1 Tax=Streptomyces sp. NPDC048376 TaxID=3154926 RepID=UPI003435F9A9
MPAYLIIHPREQRRDDTHIEDDNLTLRFEAGWAIFADTGGDCLAIPAGLGAQIQRVDEPEELHDQKPAPQKE